MFNVAGQAAIKALGIFIRRGRPQIGKTLYRFGEKCVSDLEGNEKEE